MKKNIFIFLLFFKISLIFANTNLTNYIEVTNYIVITNYIEYTNYTYISNYITNTKFITNYYTTNISKYTTPKISDQKYYIQAGIFLNKRFAENLIKKLKSQQFDAYLTDNYPYYRVLIGKNLTEKETRQILNKLKIKAIIKKME